MNPKLFLTAILFSPIVFSCNQHAKQRALADVQLPELEQKDLQAPTGDKNEEKQKIPVGKLRRLQDDSVASRIQMQPAAHIDWDKKIIKTATVKLEIKDFKKFNESIHKTIRQFGGYIAQEEQHLTDEKSESVLSIKVPVEQFESMMDELPGGDAKVLERLITSQDVTNEVIDTRSRLEARRQARSKYLDFLKDSKNMDEVLKVQGEINGIQEEIESAAGRVEYLSHQSAFSTINLTYYQPATGFKPVDMSPGFLARISNGFKAGADWIGDLLVALVSIWPLVLIITGALFVFRRVKFFKTNPQNP